MDQALCSEVLQDLKDALNQVHTMQEDEEIWQLRITWKK